MTNKIISFEEAKKHTRIKSKHLPEISVMRSLSMLCVIAIHLLNIPVSQIAVGTSWQGFYFVLRGLLIFAVPSFIFLSMVMVTYPLKVQREDYALSLTDFYKKKFFRVGLPYLLWSIFYLGLLVFTDYYKIQYLLNPSSLLYFFGFGKSYDHLYFMIILLEFYLFTPLLLPLAKRVKDSPYLSLGLAFGIQLSIYSINRFFLYAHFSMLSSTFLWYFSIGFLGLWFGLEYQRNLGVIRHWGNRLVLILIVVATIHQYYQRLLWQQLWNDLSFNTLYYTINLHLYMLLATFGLLMLSHWIFHQLKNKWNQDGRVKKYLLWISPYSYGIYLMHPLFTYLVRKWAHPSSPWMWSPIVLLSILVIATICGLITKRVQHLPVLSLGFGTKSSN